MAGEEGVTAVSEDDVDVVCGDVPATAGGAAAHEGARGRGNGAAENCLAAEHTREEVEEGGPARALQLRRSNQSLRHRTHTVGKHGALGISELPLSPKGLEANLKGSCLVHISDANRRPRRRGHSHGNGQGSSRLGGGERGEREEAWD